MQVDTQDRFYNEILDMSAKNSSKKRAKTKTKNNKKIYN
jgi:hypothetical protein